MTSNHEQPDQVELDWTSVPDDMNRAEREGNDHSSQDQTPGGREYPGYGMSSEELNGLTDEDLTIDLGIAEGRYKSLLHSEGGFDQIRAAEKYLELVRYEENVRILINGLAALGPDYGDRDKWTADMRAAEEKLSPYSGEFDASKMSVSIVDRILSRFAEDTDSDRDLADIAELVKHEVHETGLIPTPGTRGERSLGPRDMRCIRINDETGELVEQTIHFSVTGSRLDPEIEVWAGRPEDERMDIPDSGVINLVCRHHQLEQEHARRHSKAIAKMYQAPFDPPDYS